MAIDNCSRLRRRRSPGEDTRRVLRLRGATEKRGRGKWWFVRKTAAEEAFESVVGGDKGKRSG